MLQILIRRPFATIVLFSALLLAPAFLLGAGGADLQTQSLWVKLFTEQFWQGDLYPRWLLKMYAGDGSPVFFYYPPLTYFITAFFSFLLPLDAFGYYPIAVSALLAVALSGVTCYFWLKEETGSGEKALIGSLLYMAAPNHIAQNFYYAMLFSSVWAYVWLPLLMLFAKGIATGQRFSVPGFALSLGLLVMTNLPMTIIFGPLAVIYGVVFFTRGSAVSQGIRLAGAVLLGFGLSSAYLLPALLYVDFANVALHFTEIPGHTADYSRSNLFVGFANRASHLYTLYLAGAAILTMLYALLAERNRRVIYFAAASVIALIFMLPVSQFLWNTVLKPVQMAERFFAVSSVCLAFLAAVVLPRFRALSLALIVLYCVITVVIAADTRTSMEQFHKDNPLQYNAYQLDIDQKGVYLTTLNLVERFFTREGLSELSDHREKVRVLSGDARIEVRKWKPRDIAFHYAASQPSLVRVLQFDFPGFRAFKDDREVDVTRDDDTGEILLNLPSGTGEIELRLTQLLPELAGKALSIMSAAALLLSVLIGMRKRHIGMHRQSVQIIE